MMNKKKLRKTAYEEAKISEMTAQLFHDNETASNRLGMIAVIGFASLTLIVSLFGIVGIFPVSYMWSNIALVICSLIGYMLALTVYLMGYEHPKTKLVVIMALVFLSGMAYFVYPDTTVFLVFGPVLVSIKYYQPRFVIWTAVVTWFICIMIEIANTHLDWYSPVFHNFHEEQGIIFWGSNRALLLYFVIPRTVIYAIEGIVSSRIARGGRHLVMEQAEISRQAERLTSVLDTAARLQEAALPAADFVTPDGNLELHAYIQPARNVGGDFYDHFMINDHLQIVAVADVSDKGLPAAMFGIEAQSYLRFALSEALAKDSDGTVEFIDLEQALNAVNRQLCIHNMDGMFVTMWIGCFDTRTGVGKCINAGHNPPYVKQADGNLRLIDNEPQLFMGSFEKNELKARPIRIRCGETLFVYTDGVTDARNRQDEVFGTKRLEQLLKDIPVPKEGETAAIITKKVSETLNSFIGDGEQYDDITVFTVTRNGDSHSQKKVFVLETGADCGERAIVEVNRIIETLNCPDFKRRNLDVAIDEICTNITDYAYGDKKGTIEMEVHWEANYAGIRFTDSGIPFNPLEQEAPDLDGEPKIGGLGIHLVKNLVDRMEYERRDGKNLFTVYIAWNM